MKKLVIFIMSILAVIPALAQDDDEALYGKGKMPFKDKGEVVFSRVINIDADKQQIYSAMKITIADMFKSAKDVVQMDDAETCTMVVKGFHKVPTRGVADAIEQAEVWFTLKLQARDGRYKIDVYQIRGKTPAHVIYNTFIDDYYWPAESLTYEETFKKNGKMKVRGKGFFRRAIIDGSNLLMYEIELGVRKNILSSVSTEEDW